MTWLADFTQTHDLDPATLVRYRGGIGVREGGHTVSHFVGHPVHYLDGKELKPITLAYSNNKFEGVDFGWNGYAVTYKGRVLFQPESITFAGVVRPLNFWIDAPNHRLVAFVTGVGEYIIQFSEKGVREILRIPEPLEGELSFQVQHTTKPKELFKNPRHVIGTENLTGDVYQLTKNMPRDMEIDPDYAGTTGDGYIAGANATYSTARSTSTSFDIAATTMYVGQSSSYNVLRSYIKIDASGIPDGDTITQDNLKLVCTADTSATDFDVAIRKQDWSAQDPLAAGTREAAFDGCLAAASDNNIWRNTAGMSINTVYQSGDLDVTWVSKTGYTYFSLISSRDVSNTTPTGNEYILLATQDHGTAGYRPVLTVVHASSGRTSRLSLLGVS